MLFYYTPSDIIFIEIKVAAIMKKFLIFVVVIVALCTTEIELIKQPREQFITNLISMLSESTKVQRPTAASLARANIDTQVSLSEEQAAHLDEELANDLAMRQFFKQYCLEREMSLYFFTDKLENICDIVENAMKKTGTL
ncbi:hypothetical protein BET10_01385 [Pseudoalteromonas amylolytica]|uniref:Uncharacterized protein n=2 Tax=Pseudoalteromonas TaxID=53246 RepID=A0A1S1MP95_9GAMM|nr:hypothetical protein BET10_01385 [Pseudoalteromonas amylolytica]OHU89510.1 hypothetical protein BFC16_04765 [Pseudoalteromonas sp. JW3]